MRNRLVVVAVVLAAGAAQAQFANKSLGVGLGYERFNTDQPFEWAIPLSLESSLYIENSFDLTARFGLMLVTSKVSGKQFVAIAPTLGARYLFSEEALRPYAGAELTFLHAFNDIGETNYFGFGANGGVDYFVGDTVTLGGRAFVNLYLMLNVQPMTAFGAQLVGATYF
jgi:outer membrane protein